MNFFNLNKLNIIFPLKLFNNDYIYVNKKYIIIKYIYFKFFNLSFITLIKYINNNYYITMKLFHRIKKSNTINKNNLSKSTKKPWQQKGLGLARSGSFKSPLWRGGIKLFGPKNRIINIIFQIKKKKLNFFYLLLNKRTYISFTIIIPTIYTFNNFKEYLNKQKRIKGIFSKKVIYSLLNNTINIRKNNYPFISIKSLNIISFLKFNYIIFLI